MSEILVFNYFCSREYAWSRHRLYNRQCYIDHAERLRGSVVVGTCIGLTAPQGVNTLTMRSLMVIMRYTSMCSKVRSHLKLILDRNEVDIWVDPFVIFESIRYNLILCKEYKWKEKNVMLLSIIVGIHRRHISEILNTNQSIHHIVEICILQLTLETLSIRS